MVAGASGAARKLPASGSAQVLPTETAHRSMSPMMWLGGAMLAVTVLIIIGCTQFGAAAGVGIAFGSLVLAAVGVLVYIIRFIGPED